MTAPIDSCAEIKTAAYKPILVEFGGRCRKAMLGVSDKWFPSKAWSGSEYSHAFFAHCRKFLPCPNSLPSQPIHIFIFQQVFLLQPPMLLTPAQIKPVLFQLRLNSFCFTSGGRASCLHACLEAMVLSQSY